VGFGRGRMQDSGEGQHFEFRCLVFVGLVCVSRVFIRPAADISDILIVFQGFLGLYFEGSSRFSQVQWEKSALLVCPWYLRLTEEIEWQSVKWPRYDSSR
jgi:hypothetical protein